MFCVSLVKNGYADIDAHVMRNLNNVSIKGCSGSPHVMLCLSGKISKTSRPRVVLFL